MTPTHKNRQLINSNPSPTSGEGFILTRHKKEDASGLYLEYWLSTHKGPVKVVTQAQQDVFFVQQANAPSVHQQLKQARIRYEYKPLPLKTFTHQPVAALYFNSTGQAYKAKEALQAAYIECFEHDIRITERFLMERFVYGATHFTGYTTDTINTQKHPTHTVKNVCNAQLKASQYTPKLQVLSLDIECSEHGDLYSIGLAAKNYQCVLMIGEAQAAEDWIHWVEDEYHLLQALIAKVNTFDPDVIIGWNVINFDFKLLIQRAELHKIKLTLGRNNEPAHWRDSRTESNQGFITLPGRVVIDGIDALRTATYHFDSFSLEFVAQALLGVGKKTDDVDNRLAAITHDFHHNKVRLAEYNLQDCILVLDIFQHTKLIQFLILRSQLTGLELDRLGGSVAAFINLYLPKLHRAGFVSPNRPEDGGLASPGGYVMSSQPGLYEHVLVLDFKSLYPSIIRTFKVDPLGLIEGLHNPQNSIPGFKGAQFSRDKHFLPHIITTLWQQRDEAKKSNDAARSQAIKILMNSFYGVLGSGGCPFYDTRLASSITLRGHEIMQTTAQWIEEAGYTVIYGDTDSTFVWLEGNYTDAQAQHIGRTLQESINQQWTHRIQEQFQLDNHLEIEFETHFTRFLMPTIRGSQLGSKKRYAGLKSTKEGTELIFKGLETVRSDWTPLAKEFQHTLFTLIFADKDVRHYLQQILKDTLSGSMDAKLVYRKRLRRRLEHYVKNVPPHVKAARHADAINQQKGKALQYQYKGWVSYVVTINGPEPVEYATSPLDYNHYIDKQIRPIAEGILPFIGLSFDEITQPQLGLF